MKKHNLLNRPIASRLRVLLLGSILFLTSASTFAQITVKGVVKDDLSGDLLPGVNVAIKGGSVGTITDFDGNYSIEVAKDGILVFSFIGYKNQEIAVDGRTTIDVVLLQDTKALDEVVVVGYGTMKRSDMTGATVSVKEEELKRNVVNSFDQAIQGKASGVQVTQNSGSPSAATSIRIRGASSLSGTEPLYVIDGVQVNADAANTSVGFDWVGGGNGQTAVNVLATINPADIVSLEVLKDASATAIYGSRAANGVIIVTTKQGQKGKAVVEYNMNYGIQTPAKLLDVMNLREYAQYQNDIADAGYIGHRAVFADMSLVPEEGTDWQKELFRNAISQEHNVSISGGSDKTQYSISGGYRSQEGIIIGSDFERFSGRLNVTSQAKDWLKVGMNLTASRTRETINLTDSDDGVITTALLQSPLQAVKAPDGSWTSPGDEDAQINMNPIAQAMEISNNITRTRILGNVWTDIKFMPELSFRSEFGTDINFTNNYNFYPTFDWGRSVNTVARSRRNFANATYFLVKNYLTYDKTIAKHAVKFMLGQETQKAHWESLDGRRMGFVNNSVQELSVGDTEGQQATSSLGEESKVSFFGRLNYSFNNRYSLTATYRADASSKFGPNNKWGFFPSFGLGWKISEEEFLKDIDWLNNLKLRVGWGQVGNDNIGHYTYGTALTQRATEWGAGYTYNNIPNPDVKWETSTQSNIGIDISVFNNRIELIAEYYNKQTKDMLLPLPLPDYMGTLEGIGQGWQGIKGPSSNLGEMRNQGFELTINSVNYDKNGFKWNSSLTLSKNTNEVTSLALEHAVINKKVQWYDYVTRTVAGHPVGQFFGYVTEGIFQSSDEVATSPTQAPGTSAGDIKFKDINEDGKIDDQDRTVIGDPNPDFTFGFTNSFSYKNFDLSIFLNGVYGNEIFNFQRIRTESMTDLYANQLKTVTSRWSPENPNTDMPRMAFGDPNQNTRISDRYVEDGSYLRINNITLGYRLPSNLLSKLPIQNLRVFAKVQNVYTFTKYSGYDPEVGSFNQDPLLTGVDNGRFPTPRTFTFGLSVKL